MAQISLMWLNVFMPIISFLFVFIVSYALLLKTDILGNQFVNLFVSFLLASIFITRTSLVNFVQFSAAWSSVFLVSLFLIILIAGFVHGKIVDVLGNAVVAWSVIILLLIFFIVSSSYIFAWTINWAAVSRVISSDWFGFLLLVVVAGIVSWILTKS